MGWSFTWGNFFIGNTKQRDDLKKVVGYDIHEPGLKDYKSALSGGYCEKNLVTLALTIPEIFAPIHEIASRVASGEFTLRNTANGEVDDKNKAWLKLSEYPNWQETFKEFVYLSVFYKYVTGNRYIYKNVPSTLSVKPDNIVGSWILPSQYISIRMKSRYPNLYSTTSNLDMVEQYELRDGFNNRDFAPDLVYHDPFLCITDEEFRHQMKGITPLRACDMPITNIMYVYQARGIIFVKQGMLGLIVSKKSDASGTLALTPEEKEDAVKDLHGNYGITGDRSPIGISALPLDFIKMGMSIQELQPFAETEADAAVIYKTLGLETDLMPRADNSTYANQAAADRAAYIRVAIPEAKELANILTKFWGFDKIGRYIDVSFDHIETLQENKKDKSEVDKNNQLTFQGRFLSGIWTMNQWLAAIGEEPQQNPLYDKLIFDMQPDEVDMVKSVYSIINKKNDTANQSSGADSGSGNQNQGG